MPKKSIAVVADGSPEGMRAAEFASSLAKEGKGRLLVLVPMEPAPSPALVPGMTPDGIRDEVRTTNKRDALAAVETRIAHIRDQIDDSVSLEVRICETEGSVGESLISHLDPEKTLTVVLPRRRPEFLMKMLGDDLLRLAKKSPIPVTLVP